MRYVSRILYTALIGLGALSQLGCDSRAHKTDSGGVILVISDFDGLPAEVSVSAANAAGAVSIDTLTLQSNIANPNGVSGNLMDVEITSYQVTFSRADTGTRVPPALVQPSLEYVPAGGTTDIGNLRIMQSAQLSNLPLSDLENYGFDRQTNSTAIVLNCTLQFFGKTIGGRDVATEPRSFTVEFRP
jgi:hypothetical protein